MKTQTKLDVRGSARRSVSRPATYIAMIIPAFLLTGFYGCLQEDLNFTEHLHRLETLGENPHSLTEFVDTRIGTSGLPWGNGHVSPAAARPFGLVNLGPDTKMLGSETSSSGYSYTDTEVTGFSHTRYSGTGLKEGGIFRVTPANGPLNFASLTKHILLLDHQREIARPGYYQIDFATKGIKAEMTASLRGGIHRYTFSPEKTSSPRLIIEVTSQLGDPSTAKNTKVEIDLKENRLMAETTLFGGVSGRYKGLPAFLVLEPSSKIQSFRLFTATKEVDQSKMEAGVHPYRFSQPTGRLFVELAFAETGAPLEVRAAISHTDIAGAKHNFNHELLGKSFETLLLESQEAWDDVLTRIRVTSANISDKMNFYTALYRSFVMPHQFSDAPDVDGLHRFRGYDKKIHKFDRSYYANFSLWDTFRTTHPLYNLIAQKEQSDMMASLVHAGEASGRIPRWGGGAGHADSMLGFPGHIAIAEAYLKGVRDFDIEKAYSIMRSTALPTVKLDAGQECIDSYAQLGYCTADDQHESVSLTLEYAYADHAVGLLAEALGRDADKELFLKRSQSYKNLWHSGKKLFIAKSKNGSFLENTAANDSSYLALTDGAKAYVEGSPSQWRWYVIFDLPSLLKLIGQPFTVSALEEFFAKAPKEIGAFYPGTHYWHGNEPSFHSAYVFAFAGRADLTQKWVRWILESKYAAKAKGLDGDDDAGTISSWFVLSSLGFFPIAGSTQYIIGYPLFDSAELKMGRGILRIKKQNSGAANHYVKSVSINGKALTEPRFDHSSIANGGEIVFTMSHEAPAWPPITE